MCGINVVWGGGGGGLLFREALTSCGWNLLSTAILSFQLQKFHATKIPTSGQDHEKTTVKRNTAAQYGCCS